MKILIVEDTMEDLALVKKVVEKVRPEAKILVQDSFQGVVDDVLNAHIKPDAAIIDMQIFEKVARERKKETPAVRNGVEMMVRLRAIGMSQESILILTVLPQDAERDLKEAGYPKVKVISKDTYPADLSDLIEGFLIRLP